MQTQQLAVSFASHFRSDVIMYVQNEVTTFILCEQIPTNEYSLN